MFLSLMLVGFATGKFPAARRRMTSWLTRVFGNKPAQPAAIPAETAWDLGAEAWVTLPSQSSRATRADCWR